MTELNTLYFVSPQIINRQQIPILTFFTRQECTWKVWRLFVACSSGHFVTYLYEIIMKVVLMVRSCPRSSFPLSLKSVDGISLNLA
jgi:hypothetical protein